MQIENYYLYVIMRWQVSVARPELGGGFLNFSLSSQIKASLLKHPVMSLNSCPILTVFEFEERHGFLDTSVLKKTLTLRDVDDEITYATGAAQNYGIHSRPRRNKNGIGFENTSRSAATEKFIASTTFCAQGAPS